MEKIKLLTISLLVAGSSLVSSLEANCAKCSKIEAEREEEQANHPQEAGYYDDFLKNQQGKGAEEKKPQISEAKPVAPLVQSAKSL